MNEPSPPPAAAFTRFDFAALSPRDRYKLLIGTVVPRPIAWVTTVDPEGRVNAAPFSFFNVLSADPAILALGVENHADLSHKDTGRNIRLTGEFTVNIVDFANLHPMNVTAVPFPAGVDELAAAGLTALPGTHIRAPYIAEAGKPDPAAYRRGAKMLGLPVKQVVCIGDQVFRDIRGANSAGLDSILVDFIRLPGETHYGKKRALEKAILWFYHRDPRRRGRLDGIGK